MTIRPIAAAAATVLAYLSASIASADTRIEIAFSANIAGQAFDCANTYSGLGAAKTDVGFLDYRLFVSKPVLITRDGKDVPIALDQDGAWQVENIALLDFENASGYCANGTPQTNTTLRGTVPPGDYVGLGFEVGVPFHLNHGDPSVAPSPLNLTAMFWNWRGGYKFVKIETSPIQTAGMTQMGATHSEQAASGAGPRGWFLHLGSTMCAAAEATTPPTDACKNPNRIVVRLDGFDVSRNTVVIDPAPAMQGVDLTFNTPETSPGCMSFPNDPDCNTVLPQLGLPFNAFPAGAQTLVSMR